MLYKGCVVVTGGANCRRLAFFPVLILNYVLGYRWQKPDR